MLKVIKSFFSRIWKQFLAVSIKGMFWLAPIVGIIAIFSWLFAKIELVAGGVMNFFGFNPQNFVLSWTLFGVAILFVIFFVMGYLTETWIGRVTEKIFEKIPGFTTIKDVINIFNSSKKGDKEVLVVLIKGFIGNQDGYNVGLIYSLKESIIKDHYTVSLNMSPLPNGGFMFEVPAQKIFVIKDASFDHNLQYLLSMGSKPLSQIIGRDVSEVGSKTLPTLKKYLQDRDKPDIALNDDIT